MPDQADLMAAQRRLVAGLTGWSDDAGQTIPFSRSTGGERAAAAAYLFDVLAGHGLRPQRHSYQLRNVNALVDLLLPPYRGTNVFAVVPATIPSTEYVILGAHVLPLPPSPGAVRVCWELRVSRIRPGAY